MKNTTRQEQIEAYFKVNPVTAYEISLLKNHALNEFICSTGDTLDDAVKIYDFLENAEGTGDFEDHFNQATGFDFMVLERYEDLSICTVMNNITECFDSNLNTVKVIIAERCV